MAVVYALLQKYNKLFVFFVVCVGNVAEGAEQSPPVERPVGLTGKKYGTSQM